MTRPLTTMPVKLPDERAEAEELRIASMRSDILRRSRYRTPECNEVMYLHELSWSSPIAEALKPYKNLTVLCLDTNHLDRIDVGYLVNLRSLSLAKNNLTEITSLRALTSLRQVNLSYNKITSLEGLEMCTALEELNIAHRFCTTLE